MPPALPARHPLWPAAMALLATLGALLAAPAAQAWGPGGHQSIGAVADRLLAGTPTGKQVGKLLGGSLQNAATWADCARAVHSKAGVWQYQAVDNQGNRHAECAPFETPQGQAELVDYVRRNASACSAFPDHRSCRHLAYHFADLSIGHAQYDEHAVGAGPADLVHAVQAAVAVLQGRPAPAPFKLKDKREAIRLLAHFVGDLHQPLHVGVLYLRDDGHADEPADEAHAHDESTSGGNALDFEGINLHKAWDSVSSATIADATTPAAIAAARALKGRDDPVTAWPQAWASETLQAAHQALDPLRIGPRAQAGQGNWPASADEPAYRQAREALQRQQIGKAGARLAQLLRQLLP